MFVLHKVKTRAAFTYYNERPYVLFLFTVDASLHPGKQTENAHRQIIVRKPQTSYLKRPLGFSFSDRLERRAAADIQ